jgi:maleylpyruvate isomerase
VAKPEDALTLLAGATARLLATAERCDEDAIRAPSLLPDWTVGHVLTHLARNADSHVRRLEAAVQGQVIPQYEGGRDARDAAIEVGAVRSKPAILEDLVTACEQLARVLATFPDELWDQAIVQREYFTAPAATLPFTRLIEVEVHHADLGRGYGPADWPLHFTDRALEITIERLELRGANVCGPAASWHLHQTDGDGEWLLRRSPAGSTITAEHARADCAIRGRGHGLLAWLLGRLDAEAAGLDVVGDATLAAALPSLYAYG